MSREISDKLKADSGKIMCDAYACADRGKIPRCYLECHSDCNKYIAFKRFREKYQETLDINTIGLAG